MGGEEREEKEGRMEEIKKDLETLLRVLQVSDSRAAFAAIDIIEKEAVLEEAENESEEESCEEKTEEEEEEEIEDIEDIGSDISDSD